MRRLSSTWGGMYYKGQGVPQYYQEAVRWYQKAPEQGNASAQSNLGIMYDKGRGVAQDYIQAYVWASLAAAQGDEDAVQGLKMIKKEMTPAQLAEAQRLARKWIPKGE